MEKIINYSHIVYDGNRSNNGIGGELIRSRLQINLFRSFIELLIELELFEMFYSF